MQSRGHPPIIPCDTRTAAQKAVEFFDHANAPVAQLDRASAFEAEGREFESLRARHPPNLIQSPHKHVSQSRGRENRKPTVTTESDKVQMAEAVNAFQALGHGRRRKAPRSPTERRAPARAKYHNVSCRDGIMLPMFTEERASCKAWSTRLPSLLGARSRQRHLISPVELRPTTLFAHEKNCEARSWSSKVGAV